MGCDGEKSCEKNVGRVKDKNQDHVWHCAIYYNEKQQQLNVI